MTNYNNLTQEQKELICGKCDTKQTMKKRYFGNKENEFSWYCPNCNDLISQSAVRGIKDEKI